MSIAPPTTVQPVSAVFPGAMLMIGEAAGIVGPNSKSPFTRMSARDAPATRSPANSPAATSDRWSGLCMGRASAWEIAFPGRWAGSDGRDTRIGRVHYPVHAEHTGGPHGWTHEPGQYRSGRRPQMTSR